MKKKASNSRALLAGAASLALLATPLAGADYQDTVLSQGPVGYWRLNETVQPQPTQPASNLGSVAGAVGTYNNFPIRGVPGPFTGSLGVEVDGSSQTITTPYDAAINPSTFSVEIWAKPALVPNFAYLAASAQIGSPRSGWYLAQDNGTTFGRGNAFVVRLFKQDGSTPSAEVWATNDLPQGSWYHLVLTYDGTTATLYKNGVVASSVVTNVYVPNQSGQFSVGCRSDNAWYWPGQVAEVAIYNGALSATDVANHYTTATTTPADYQTTVLANSPLLYWRFNNQTDPSAANLGSLGASVNGAYIYNARAGVTGPIPATYPGFDSANKAVAFDAGGGVVSIPALNLNTNTVTISCWVNATNAQPLGAGLVVCNSGATTAGLTIDQIYGGYGLGYVWGGDTYDLSPSVDLGLPPLPDSQWAYVALVIQPTEADLYVCDQNNYLNFTSVTNTFAVNHLNQAFGGLTLIGAEAGFTTKNFNGAVDEVAIFNRSLEAGELYTQYASAVGGVPPRIFADIQGPVDPVLAGDPLVLRIDVGGTPPLTYTWRRNGTTVGTTDSGTLTIDSSTLLDSGNYDVTVANGSGTVDSLQVPVTVITPSVPSITERKGFIDRSLYPGATLNLSVVATGGGLKYQWYKDSTAIDSATTSAYVIPTVAAGDAGSYSVTVTNLLGTASAGPVAITVLTPAAGSYEALMVSAAPEAWWRLGEAPSSTNLFDSMGRHDGYYTNLNGSTPPVTLGVPGALSNDPDTAASFNPTYGGVGVIPWSAAMNTTKSSMEAWVKTTVLNGIVPFSSVDTNGNGAWCEAINGWWYGNSTSGYFGNNGNVNTDAQIVPGEWSHVVITYDATRSSGGTFYPYILFVNGRTDGYVWGGSTTPNSGAPFIIGGHNMDLPTLVDRLFDGQVDEVAVYSRALSGTEIQSHFEGRFGSTTAPYFLNPFLPQTVTTGKSVSFVTSVQGSKPIALQWYMGGTAISGATTTTHTIPSTAVTDSGSYTLWATNVAGTNFQSVNLTVVEPTSYANATNNLVLHLRFDGDTTDSSGRGNDGTAVGTPAYVAGQIGSQAIQYTTETVTNPTVSVSSANYVTLGTPSDLQFGLGSFSIALWVKLPSGFTGGDLPFIGNAIYSMNNPGWDLGPSYGGGGWQWCLNDGVTGGLGTTNNVDLSGADGSINDGAWHHFVLVVDRTTHAAETYLDVVLLNSTDISSLRTVDTSSVITVGQDPTGTYPVISSPTATDLSAWGQTQTHTLDDLGIWKRALSPLEVAQIESAGSAGNSFDTVNPAVTITVTRSGDSITLSWPNGTLLQSDTLGAGASWTAVPDASAPSYTFTVPTTGNKFYRVQVSP